MEKLRLDFLNTIHRPCCELDRLLLKPLLHQDNSSIPIKNSIDLSSAINHFSDKVAAYWEVSERNEVRNFKKMINDSCDECRILHDVSDMAKHGSLDRKRRENSLSVGLVFEFNEDEKCRFHRGIVTIDYGNNKRYDFLETAIKSTNFLNSYYGFGFDKIEGPHWWEGDWDQEAKLYFVPEFCTYVKNFNLKTVRCIDGKFVPYDPEKVQFTTYKSESNKAFVWNAAQLRCAHPTT